MRYNARMGALLHSVDDIFDVLALAEACLPQDVARVAVFDADGTLWRGDIGDTAFAAAADAGLVNEKTWSGPVRTWAARWAVSLPEDPRVGLPRILAAAHAGELAQAGRARGLDDGAWRRELYEMQAWIYAGHSRAAVEAFGERLFAAGFAAQIFTDMGALLRGLRARHVDVYVASASHGALVAPGARRLDVDRERALGMEPAVDEEGRGLPRTSVCTYGPGKAAVVRKVLEGKRPLLAFGDSVLGTDKELLESAHRPFAIASSGVHREAALRDPRMHLFDPTR